MAVFSLQELHDRIESDPNAIGYKNPDTTWKDDQIIVDLANAKTFAIDRRAVEMTAVRAATHYDAYNDLLADKQEWLRWMTPNSGLFERNADMKLQLTGRTLTVNGAPGTGDNSDSFWSVGERDVVAPAMLALIEVPGSDAEIAWGENTFITAVQVGGAANL